MLRGDRIAVGRMNCGPARNIMDVTVFALNTL